MDLRESLSDNVQVQLSTIESSYSTNSPPTIPVDLIFSSNIESLGESSIQVTGGTIVPGSLTGSGKNYTMQITPLGDGVVEINFPSQNVVVVGAQNPKLTNSSSVSVVVDTTYPTVLLTTNISSPTTSTSLPVTVTFSEPIEGLTISDFSIVGGGASITSLTGSGGVYQLQILPVLAASIEIELPANTVTDLVGNRNYASNKLTIVYDNTVPAPTLSTGVTSPTNLTSIPVAISFAGVDVTGLQLSDFTITNGVLSGLSGSGSSYTINITPSGSGVVSLQLPANTVVNALNTANSASNILSLTVDYVVPTLNITGPNPNSGNSSTSFEWTVTYAGHDSISLVAANVTLNTSGVVCVGKTVTGSGATRTVTVSGCSGDGTVGITVAAGTATDLAGNSNLAGTSSLATVDNTGPTLNITGPVPAEGNSLDSFVWTLTYADHSAITLADGDVSIVSTGSVGSCTKVVSASGNPRTVTLSGCTGNGTVKISVAASTAADALGNQVAANNSALDATVDNTAPTISIGSVNPATGNSNTNFEWVVTYGDANAVSLVAANVSITGLGNTAGCIVSIENPVGFSQRTVRIHGCTQSGSMGISIPSGTASDVAGNLAPAASSASSATIDSSTFTATLASVSSTVNNLSSIPVTVTFSDTTSDFTSADLNLVNASISGFAGSGTSYSFNLIPGADGTVSVNIPANVAVNSFATQNIASNTLSFTVDTVKPTLAIVGPTPTQGNSAAEFVWTINYTGVNNAISLAAGNVTLGGTATAGCLKTVEGTGLTTRTVKVTGCTGNGTLNITLAANTATDLAGNQTDASSVSSDATVDNLGPGLAVSSPNTGYGNNATSFVWTLTYTDYSTISLTAADITIVTTGTVNSCTKAVGGSGSNRTVTITNCLGDGTVKFDIAANTAVDASGNQVGAITNVTVANVDNIPPTLDITGPTPSSGNNSTSFEWTLTYDNYSAPALTISAADISMVYTGTASGCTKSLSGSGAIRTVTLTNCTGDGTVKIQVAAGTAADSVGNSVGAHTTASTATLDNTGPTLNITGPTPTIGKNGTSFVYTVNYSGASSVSLSSVTLIGTDNTGCAAAITGSGTAARTVTITGCTGNGTVGFAVASGTAQDTYGNLAGTATSGYATVDNQAPTITIGTPTPLYGKSTTTFEWLITYTGADTITLVAANTSLSGSTAGCTKGLTSVSAGVYKVTASGCTGNGTLGMSIVANTAQDSVGNQAASAMGSTVTVDNVSPVISVVGPTPSYGNSTTTFSWVFTYTDADTISLNNSNVIIMTAGVLNSCDRAVSGTGNTRTVTISGCMGNGTVYPYITVGSGQDNAGNMTAVNSAATPATVDNTPPTIPTVNMHNPASNSGSVATPELIMTNIVSGDVVFIYTDNACTNQIASGTASSTSLNLTTSALVEGSYNFYVRSVDSVGNSTSCTNTGVTYTYLSCTSDQRLIEGTCANPILVTLGSTTNDPGIYFETSGGILSVELSSNTPGVVTQANQGGFYYDTVKLNPTGDSGVQVRMWPSQINLNLVRFCSLGYSGNASIKALNSMGSYKSKYATSMFQDCTELTEISDIIGLSESLSNATNFSYMFSNALVFNQSLEGLDTSNVRTMTFMFQNARAYNQPLPSTFNTSNVTDMSYMFFNAIAYNQPLPSSFDTSNVTNMSTMFGGASSYNQALPSSFDTSNVTDMSNMFNYASSYNQPLPSSFDTSNVTNMSAMFGGTSSYNQPLPSSFNTSNVTDMSYMFGAATSYNQPLPSSFNTSNVTDMSYMFYGTMAYNQPFSSSFNTSNVTNMAYMFHSAGAYNQALPLSFNTSNVTNMYNMFNSATSYNQPLPSSFDTSNVTNMSSMFNYASSYNQPLPSSFDTSNVTNMSAMFGGTSSYNQPLPSSFNTSNVTDMSYMFGAATSYNQPLPSSFDTSNVTNMSSMFYNAQSYNQPFPSSFNTSNVTNMSSMFYYANAYNQNLRGSFNVCNVTDMNSFSDGAPIDGTVNVPIFGDLDQCNKGGPQ